MATYKEAEALLRRLKPIIDKCIENHPLVKSAVKVRPAATTLATPREEREGLLKPTFKRFLTL